MNKNRLKPKSFVVEFVIAPEHISQLTFENSDGKKKGEVRVVHAYPRLSHWQARTVSSEINPRDHNEYSAKSAVSKAIKQTLTEDHQNFHLRNRGMTILADDFEYDPETKWAKIIIKDSELEGLLDGASSDWVVAEHQKELLGGKNLSEIPVEQIPISLTETRVHLEFIVGVKDRFRIADIVEARNTSKQLKTYSLADFKHEFDWIKDSLSDTEFSDKIGYDENAMEDVSVLDVLSLLTLFHPIFDRDQDITVKSPTIAYTNKGKLDAYLRNPDMHPGYKDLAPLIPDILRLHDKIYQSFPEMYGKAFSKVKLGRRKGFESRQGRSKYKLPLTEAECDYTIASSYVMVLLGGFRALITYGEKGINWASNPFEFWDRNGHILIRHLIDQIEEVHSSPNQLGKSKTAYSALYREVKLLQQSREKKQKEEVAVMA